MQCKYGFDRLLNAERICTERPLFLQHHSGSQPQPSEGQALGWVWAGYLLPGVGLFSWAASWHCHQGALSEQGGGDCPGRSPQQGSWGVAPKRWRVLSGKGSSVCLVWVARGLCICCLPGHEDELPLLILVRVGSRGAVHGGRVEAGRCGAWRPPRPPSGRGDEAASGAGGPSVGSSEESSLAGDPGASVQKLLNFKRCRFKS